MTAAIPAAARAAGGASKAGSTAKVSTTKAAPAAKPAPAKPAAAASTAGKDVATGQAGQTGRAGRSVSDSGKGLADLLSSGSKKTGSKALVAEFVICMLILLLSPLTHSGADVTVAKFMKKGSATAGVFVILGFVSAGGGTARKVAQGLGLLMTLTVLLNERSVFGEIVKAVSGEGVSIPKPAGAAGGDDGVAETDPTGEFTFTTDPVTGAVSAESNIAVNRWGANFGEWIYDNFLGGHDDPGQWTDYGNGRKSSGGTF